MKFWYDRWLLNQTEMVGSTLPKSWNTSRRAKFSILTTHHNANAHLPLGVHFWSTKDVRDFGDFWNELCKRVHQTLSIGPSHLEAHRSSLNNNAEVSHAPFSRFISSCLGGQLTQKLATPTSTSILLLHKSRHLRTESITISIFWTDEPLATSGQKEVRSRSHCELGHCYNYDPDRVNKQASIHSFIHPSTHRVSEFGSRLFSWASMLSEY